MKRRTLRLLLLLMLLAEVSMAENVDRGRARQAATTFLNNNGAQTIGLTDVTSATGFSNVYVFTTENSFVLMAADDRVQPILGYSLNGRFDIENMSDNKRAWIEEYTSEIQYAIEHQTRATTEVSQQWRDLVEGRPNAGRATTVVSPLVQTKWNQTSPYNMLCPGGSVTGCVATAMAQIMKYWNYPSHGIGSHSYIHATYGVLSADFQSTTYDWNNMTNTYTNSSTNAQKQAVATLMYHCGVSVEMTYSPNASSASTADVAYALKTYFGYSDDVQHLSRSAYSDSDWIALLKAELDQNRPIQYHGTGSGGGHSFVFDGYNNNNKFHVNWGWGGSCDEYYAISNLNPGPGGTGSGAYGIYNDGQGAVVGIHPSGSTANAPSNLTYSQNGRTVTLSWSAASGASSYKVYRNNSFIGNAPSASYTDTAPYGSSVYYVRSVDSQGRLSLSSNAVTVNVAYPTPVVNDLAATVSSNNVNLTWTAPEWCYPETPSESLSYGEGNIYYSWTSTYYAHRYLAADLAQYANKAVYKVATYVQYPGTYSAYVYTNSTSNNQPASNACAMSKVGIEVSSTGWFEFEADEPIILSSGHDLWVVMKQENTGQSYPTPSFNLSSHNTNAFYAGSNSPTSLHDANSSYNCAWLIKAYITDVTYTYNIYRNGASIANNVSSCSYCDNNLTPGVYSYYLKTNYYAGETTASNQVTVQIGTGTPYTISASASPSSGGSVSGAGSYNYGTTCTLIATPATGYSFVRWTKNGSQVSTSSTYSFTVTASASYVAVFEQSTTTQSQTLSNGWNWWSSYIELSGIDGLTMLENSLSTSGLTIKSRLDGYVDWYQYNGTTGWYGSLNSICNEQMYKINMSANRSVSISGLLANQSNHPITINSGWNWIGFPLSQSVGVDVAMSGFSPAVDDVIKGRNSYTTYFSSNGTTGWFGSLNTLEPGCGYMYQSQSSGTKTLVFQPGRGEAVVANITPENNVYQPSDQRFADNMTVTAVVETEGEELRSDSYELATFVDGECRGSVRLLYVEPIDRYVAFLTVFGNQGDVLEFRLTDGTETQVSADGLVFASDGMEGTLASPKVLHFGTLGLGETSAMVRIYPNPVRRRGTLNIALPEASGTMVVEIGNVLGVTMFRGEVVVDPTSVAHVTLPDAMLPGTYVLKAIRADGTVYYGKLIVK